MNDQAEQVLSQLLQRAVDGVDKAVELSQSQIPDVIEQLLLWNGVFSGVEFALAVFMMIITLVVFVKSAKMILEETREKGVCDQRDSRIVFPGAVSAVMIMVTAAYTMNVADLDWLQILIAPKLYLIEYGAELVK